MEAPSIAQLPGTGETAVALRDSIRRPAAELHFERNRWKGEIPM